MKLPICLNINMNNMLNYAFPLSIIMAHPHLYPWSMENYFSIGTIDWYKQSNTVGLYMLYLDGFSYADISMPTKILGQNSYSDYYLMSLDIIEIIKHHIRNNQYVVVFVDEYYLPGTQLFGYQHFLHEELIYGYDDSQHTLYSLGMSLARCYARLEYTYEDFKIAYQNGYKCDVHGNIEWARNHRIITLDPNAYSTQYPYSSSRVINKLRGIIDNTVLPDDVFFLNTAQKGTLITNQRYVERIVNLIFNNDPLSFRYVHHLREYCILLYERLHYLSNNIGFSDNTFLSGIHSKVILPLSAARLDMIKINKQQHSSIHQKTGVTVDASLRLLTSNITSSMDHLYELLALYIKAASNLL